MLIQYYHINPIFFLPSDLSGQDNTEQKVDAVLESFPTEIPEMTSTLLAGKDLVAAMYKIRISIPTSEAPR